jgi:hypothetical protein
MSFLSPLERLADKFNILQFNTRELISKLSYWNSSTDDFIDIMLKCEDAPYFEKYTIPSKQYIKTNSIGTWTNTRNNGVKFWGSSLLAEENKTVNDYGEDSYVYDFDPTTSPKTNYIEYTGASVVNGLIINMLPSNNIGDIVDFVIKLNPTNTLDVSNIIAFQDSLIGETILSFGSNSLSSVQYSTGNNPNYKRYPKYIRVSLQMIKSPYISTNSWAVCDYYEIPSFRLDGSPYGYSINKIPDPFA